MVRENAQSTTPSSRERPRGRPLVRTHVREVVSLYLNVPPGIASSTGPWEASGSSRGAWFTSADAR
ncbi:hypothetical protein ACHAWF_015410 [Thalassiosira exigua]